MRSMRSGVPDPTHGSVLQSHGRAMDGPCSATRQLTAGVAGHSDSLRRRLRPRVVLVIYLFFNRSDNGFGMNIQIKPFDDIRVRKAMQMALNLEEINSAYYKGFADTIPQGQLNRSFAEAVTEFEDWPEDVKRVFDYDPEGAEALLDEAGYPRGADGTRFKTVMVHLERYDLNYVQLVASYWKRIGVDVDPQVHPLALMVSRRSERDFEMINAEAAGRWFPLAVQQRYTTAAPWNISNVDDPWYEAKFLEGAAATTIEEQNNISQ